MPRLLTLRSFVGVIATVLVAACGGGGGGPSGPGVPVIAAGTPPSGLTGTAYAGYAFSVASGGAAPFQWSTTGTMPPGLALDAGGHLAGTPVTAGTYNVTIIVTDASTPALTGNLPVSLKIADSTIVVAAAPTPPAGVASNPYAGYTFTASGGSPPYTWAVTPGSGALPGGLTLASNGTLSGTPTTAGPFAFSVTATDSAQAPTAGAPQPFNITINAPPPAVIDPGQTPPAGVHGTPYSFTFTATGGYLPLNWAVTAGALPPGLTLGSNGTISGTPTAANATPFAFTVGVSDSGAPPQPATPVAYAITVSDPLPPTISLAPPQPATVGTPYAFQIVAFDGLAPLRWSVMPSPALSASGLGVGLDGLLSGTPSTAGHFPITVDVTDALSQTAPPATVTVRISLARPALTFTATGSMRIPRSGHTATLLNTGKVLVTGGPDASAELYDPATGLFTDTGSMTEARVNHSATLLNVADHTLANYGKVLIVGSVDASAELYDPAAGTFTATGSMTQPRTRPVATLLTTGKVLIVGGNTVANDLLTAELYDPATGTFTATGPMTTTRTRPTATLLTSGKVLVTGDIGSFGGHTAELYDPASGTFTPTGNMTVNRAGHVAIRLQDGTVLVVGTEATADLYDPVAGTFTSLGNASPVRRAFSHTASLRNDGSVLITGADDFLYLYTYVRDLQNRCVKSRRPVEFPVSSTVTALFAPESEAFMLAGDAAPERDGGHTATALPDETVLMVGGTQHIVGLTPLCPHAPISVATPLSSAVLIK